MDITTAPAPLTDDQLVRIDALSRVSALDPRLTPAQRHEIHNLMAEIAGTPRPLCCR